jgi:hypothetical protein
MAQNPRSVCRSGLAANKVRLPEPERAATEGMLETARKEALTPPELVEAAALRKQKCQSCRSNRVAVHRMSLLGQTETSARVRATSAIPPTADIGRGVSAFASDDGTVTSTAYAARYRDTFLALNAVPVGTVKR